MGDFDHILNWKLKSGSHTFPGPGGGTCINEAAIVAAGYKYRPVRTVNDMPSLFSRPICAFAMSLNDMANDQERQQLLPFVTRLACSDNLDVERARAEYIELRAGFGLTFAGGLIILEGALAIGRQAEPIGDARSNLDAVRPTPSAKKPLGSKLKALLQLAGA